MSLSNTGPLTSTPSSHGPIQEKSGGDTRLTLPPSHFQSSTQPRNSRRKNLVCLSIFLTLEAGYFALAAFCFARHITLPIPRLNLLGFNLNLADHVKGGFTVIFVIWQKFAIFLGTSFVVDAFSREWSVRLSEHTDHKTSTKDLFARKVDSVSTITSGFFDGATYLRSHYDRTSGTFKLAFLASLSFVLLSSLASGTIVATMTLINTPVTIHLGRLPRSNATVDDMLEIATAQSRANTILRLEKIENSPFGFELPDNMLTAVPMTNLSSFNGTIEYDSDVIEFRHYCYWEAPRFIDGSDGVVVVSAGGQEWFGANVGSSGHIRGSSVGPLYLDPIAEQVGISAFIFSGGNASITVPQTTPGPPTLYAIDLGSLPVTFTQSGAGFDIGADSVYAPLSTVLVCDPQTKITGGCIRVMDNGTLTVISSRQAPRGNIPQSAANFIFATAFGSALFPFETPDEFPNIVNDVASKMFMSNASVNWTMAHNIHPLDLPSINKNMDTYMLSAAKAYLDGHNEKNGTGTVVNFDSEKVDARGQKRAFVLSTTKWLFVPTVVLVVISTVSLLAIFMSSDLQSHDPFDLENVYGALERRLESEGRNRLLPGTQSP